MNTKKTVKKTDFNKQKTKSVKISKPKEPPKPVIEEISSDLYIGFQSGELYPGKNVIRSVVAKERKYTVDGELKIEKTVQKDVEGLKYKNGFGQDQPDSLADFIRRNSEEVLNKIFDLKTEV